MNAQPYRSYAEKAALSEDEWISSGEEILTRVRLIAEAVERRVHQAMHNEPANEQDSSYAKHVQ